MELLVTRQIGALAKTFAAARDIAPVGLFSVVDPHVLHERAMLCKTCVTLLASVGFVPSVGSYVLLQGFFAAE